MAHPAQDEDVKMNENKQNDQNVNLNEVAFEIMISKDGFAKWKMISSKANQLTWDSTILSLVSAALGNNNTNAVASMYRLKFEASSDLRWPILFYKNDDTLKDVFWAQLAMDKKSRILARKTCFINATLVSAGKQLTIFVFLCFFVWSVFCLYLGNGFLFQHEIKHKNFLFCFVGSHCLHFFVYLLFCCLFFFCCCCLKFFHVS